MRNSWLLIFVFFTSCFLPDVELPMTPVYETEIYISLYKNQTTYVDLSNVNKLYDSTRGNWHLKFDNAVDGWSIFLNTIGGTAVHNTKLTDFDKVDKSYDLLDRDWQLDVPTSVGSISAIGEWGDFQFSNPESYKNVYLISWNDGSVGFHYKLQILDAKDDAYHIRYGTLDGSVLKSQWIKKSVNRSYSYFSFNSRGVVAAVEPAIEDWNICFTYLSDSISDNLLFPYKKTVNKYIGIYQGLVINNSRNSVALDTTVNFNDLDYFYAKELNFERVDKVPNLFYKWDIANSSFLVDKKTSLIVKNGEKYFAVKPVDVVGANIEEVQIKLKIKQL